MQDRQNRYQERQHRDVPPDSHEQAAPPAIQYAQPGDTVTLELPWSEVCMSMRVAGRTAQVTLLPGDDSHRAAQILDDAGQTFSFPILAGEAGFYRNTDGWYYYPPSPTACGWTCTDIGLG